MKEFILSYCTSSSIRQNVSITCYTCKRKSIFKNTSWGSKYQYLRLTQIRKKRKSYAINIHRERSGEKREEEDKRGKWRLCTTLGKKNGRKIEAFDRKWRGETTVLRVINPARSIPATPRRLQMPVYVISHTIIN